MRYIKKILEMRSQNYSQHQIASALKISRDMVRKIFNSADSKKICWSSIQDLSESNVQKLLFDDDYVVAKPIFHFNLDQYFTQNGPSFRLKLYQVA